MEYNYRVMKDPLDLKALLDHKDSRYRFGMFQDFTSIVVCDIRVTVDQKGMQVSPDSMASPGAQDNPVDRAPKATPACRVNQEQLATKDRRVPKEESETKVQRVDVGTLVIMVPRELVGSPETREHPEMMASWASKAHREQRDRRERVELRFVEVDCSELFK